MKNAGSVPREGEPNRFIGIGIFALLAVLVGGHSTAGAISQASGMETPSVDSDTPPSTSANGRLFSFIANVRNGSDINRKHFERYTRLHPTYIADSGNIIRYGHNLESEWAHIFTLNLREKLLGTEFNTLRVAIVRTIDLAGADEVTCTLDLVKLTERLTSLGYRRMSSPYRGSGGIKARFDKESLQIRTVSQYLNEDGGSNPCVLSLTITGELRNE